MLLIAGCLAVALLAGYLLVSRSSDHVDVRRPPLVDAGARLRATARTVSGACRSTMAIWNSSSNGSATGAGRRTRPATISVSGNEVRAMLRTFTFSDGPRDADTRSACESPTTQSIRSTRTDGPASAGAARTTVDRQLLRQHTAKIG